MILYILISYTKIFSNMSNLIKVNHKVFYDITIPNNSCIPEKEYEFKVLNIYNYNCIFVNKNFTKCPIYLRNDIFKLLIEEIYMNIPVWKYKCIGKISVPNKINLDIEIYLDKDKVNLFKKIKSKALHHLILQEMSNSGNIYKPKTLEQKKLKDVNIKLYPFQYNTVMWMHNLENKQKVKKIDYTIYSKKLDIKYDILNRKVISKNCYYDINTKGGVLGDEMGLGKTITTIVASSLNKLDNNKILKFKNGLIQSKATLIFMPSHLAKQWVQEIKKVLPKAKVVTILTKTNHVKLTYRSLAEADYVLVTKSFLTNFKYYLSLKFFQRTLSTFIQKDRIVYLRSNMPKPEVFNFDEKAPILEYFHWNRLVIDEGHEIYNGVYNYRLCDLLIKWFYYTSCNYKWFVSGTPHLNVEGFKSLLDFFNITFEFKHEEFKEKVKVNPRLELNLNLDLDFIKKQIVVRHTKNVINQLNMSKSSREVKMIELTDFERQIYEARKKNMVSNDILIQICCHLVVAYNNSSITGNNVELSKVKDNLFQHHENRLNTYKKKLEALDDKVAGNKIIIGKYKEIVSKSKYMLTILDKINNMDKEETCSICHDIIQNMALTECGHIFCKECLMTSLSYANKCPMCNKKDVAKNVYVMELGKNKVKDKLVDKYGSKMGYLIRLCQDIKDENNRIIIFSQFDKMLQLVGNTLNENNVSNTFVKGNVYQRIKQLIHLKKEKN